MDENDKEKLIDIFEGLEVKPKLDDVESLHQWMEQYLKGKGRIKESEPIGQVGDSSNDLLRRNRLVPPPRLTSFSGGKQSNEIAYETWKYEVLNLLREPLHTKQEVESAVRKSLRGGASDTVRRLGLDVSINDILCKLDGVYGVVENTEDLLKQFYSASQTLDESVSAWGCRLEDLLDRAIHQNPIYQSQYGMLKSIFWSGLLPQLKEASRHMKDSIPTFEMFLIEVRKIEGEKATIKQPVTTKAQLKAVSSESSNINTELDQLKGLVSTMGHQVKELAESFKQYQIKADSGKPVSHNVGYHGRGQGHSRARGRPCGNGQYRDDEN